jgi:hypothetical protein
MPAGTPAQIAEDYLTAFYTGDFGRARDLVAETFAFSGPFLQAEGRDAFFDGAQGLKNIVRGHRTVRQWSDGEDVCTVHEVELQTPAGQGVVLMSEWHTVREGRLAAGQVVFDTARFRALLPA